MTTCPRCRSQNPSDVRFCSACGAPMKGSGTLAESPSTVPLSKPVPPPLPPVTAAQPQRRDTIVEPPSEAINPQRPGRPVPPQSVPGSPVRTTQFMPAFSPAASAAAPVLRTDDRRIVGVLLTYSWKPSGEIFAVREGRNIIGRGDECDICVRGDESLSEKHAHITYRKNFVIGDLVSMSGTFVNGEPVEEQFVPLQNHAEIRTGSTHWKFVAVESPHTDR